MRRLLLAALGTLGLCAPLQAEPGDGARLFADRCGSCHATTQPAAGDRWLGLYQQKGPSLADAGNKFRAGYLQQWLVKPVSVRNGAYPYFRATVSTAEGDRLVPPPFHHVTLDPAEAAAVAEYLGGLQRPPAPFPQAPPVQTVSGKVLFDKIAACGGCHQIAPGDPPRSGPNLAGVRERLNEHWLAAYLHDPQQAGALTMPRVRLRADQIAALLRYVAAPEASAGTPAAGPPGAAGKAPPAVTADRRGALIYRMLCSQCHGIEGDGRGINAPFLSVEPRNHRSREEMRKLSDDHLLRVIRYGGTAVNKSALMPSWGNVLDEADINDLVAYLRELSG